MGCQAASVRGTTFGLADQRLPIDQGHVPVPWKRKRQTLPPPKPTVRTSALGLKCSENSVRRYVVAPEQKPILKISVALTGRGAMATAISNWRLLEADIVDCLQQHGVKITRDNFGNPHCATINIHE